MKIIKVNTQNAVNALTNKNKNSLMVLKYSVMAFHQERLSRKLILIRFYFFFLFFSFIQINIQTTVGSILVSRLNTCLNKYLYKSVLNM